MPNAAAIRNIAGVHMRRRRHGRATAASTTAAPQHRSHATVCGGTVSNRLYAMAAPLYMAMPPATKQAGAVRREISGAATAGRRLRSGRRGVRQPAPLAQRVDHEVRVEVRAVGLREMELQPTV